MTVAMRWDPTQRRYLPHELPCPALSALSARIGEVVCCASCGTALPYDETYVSLEIHAMPGGFGYAVCPSCYRAEIERRAPLDGFCHLGERAPKTNDERMVPCTSQLPS